MIVLVGIQTNKGYGYFQPQLDLGWGGSNTVFRASSFLLQSEAMSISQKSHSDKQEKPWGEL